MTQRLRASSGRSSRSNRDREFVRFIESLKTTHDAMDEPKPAWPVYRDRELQAKRVRDGKRLSNIGTDLSKIRNKG